MDVNATSFLLNDSEYTELSTNQSYAEYTDSSGTVYRGLTVDIASGFDATEDPYIKQICAQTKYTKCDYLLPFQGFFIKGGSQAVLIYEYHNGSLEDYVQQNFVNKEQLIQLGKDLTSALNSLNTNYSFVPEYITPKNIVINSDKGNESKLAIKLAGLRSGITVPPNDQIWTAPEHFKNIKGASLYFKKELAIVYSMALNILFAANKKCPTTFRESINPSQSFSIQAKEPAAIMQEMKTFQETYGLSSAGGETLDGKFKKLMELSLKYSFSLRNNLEAWAGALGGISKKATIQDSKKAGAYEQERNVRLAKLLNGGDVDTEEKGGAVDNRDSDPMAILGRNNQNQISIPPSRGPRSDSSSASKINCGECCEGPQEVCKEWFEKFWFVYGCICGLFVSVFIIMMSLGFEK